MLGILVIASVNVINHAMLVSICIRKPVSRKRLVDKLAECSENIDEAKLSEVVLFEHINKCVCSYTACIVLAVIALTVSIGVGANFTYIYISLNKENVSIYDYVFEAKSY